MINIVYFEGVKAIVRQVNFKFLAIAVLAVATLFFTGCSGTTGVSNAGNPGATDTAATVNGKAITMEAVEKVIKQQGQGQEGKLSPLELATARLQVLQQLIQQEVLYQKADAEKTVPSEEKVTEEFNKMKTGSGKSAEEIAKQMQEAGETEASVREGIKKQLAINALVEKITSKVDAPKDSEITAFYDGNKEAFVKKRGVKLAAIVVDPTKSGEGDTTIDEQSAVLRGNEIIKQLQSSADFATLAREKSEDQSRLQGGDLGYISEEEMKQSFPPQVAATLMDPKFQVGQILPTPIQGKFYILKLQERTLAEENLTLESPGVRQRITDELIKSRKDILSSSYAAVAMNEAKVENYLARKVVENPNELSGARPASANVAPVNTNTNVSTANTNTNANSAANTATANTNVKPAANTAANANRANTR